MPKLSADEVEALARQGFFRVADAASGMSGQPEPPYVGYRCPACQGVHADSPDMNGSGHLDDCWLASVLQLPEIVNDIIRAVGREDRGLGRSTVVITDPEALHEALMRAVVLLVQVTA